MLGKKDIEYIQKDLRSKGLAYDELQDELIDHVCVEVELLLTQGWEFKKAYEKVLLEIKQEDLLDVQNLTYEADNYHTMMIVKNNFKIMLRNLTKRKSHTLLNIAGLVVGLSCFLLISMYIKHELTYDQFLSKYHSLYRVTMSSTVGGKTNYIPTSFPTLGPLVKENFNELGNYTRIINYKYSRQTPTFRHEDKVFYEDKVLLADSTFFKLFDFPFIDGDPSTALQGPQSVVITENIARKYFGQLNVVGKTLNFNNKIDLAVTGVMKDLPSNGHIQCDFVIPIGNMSNSGIFSGAKALESWQIDWFWTYFIIPDKTSVARIESGLNRLAKDKAVDFTNPRFYLQPVSDIHLHSDFDYGTDISPNSDMNSLYIFIAVGILILFISCINFINLSIAAATRRYKEIGISKVLGALRSQLRFQFLMESVAIVLVAFLVAISITQLALPFFEGLLGVVLERHWWANTTELTIAFAFVIFIGVVSGLYPAFFVSSFEPQRVLKGVWRPGKGGTQFRTVLVGMQIVISLFLVIGTLIVYQQMNFVKHKDLGYSKEQIIMLTVKGTAIPKLYYALKDKLESNTAILSVSSVSEPIGREVQFMAFRVEGQKEDQVIKILNVGYDFVKTMGLQLKEGRDFSKEIASDSASGFMINESAAKFYGWNEPLGKTIRHAFWDGAPEGAVVGVIKDFNFEPLHSKVEPLIIFKGQPSWFIAVRLQPNRIQEGLSFIESSWKEFEPAKPFNFHFLDQSIQKVYEKEERVSSIFLAFSILSIFTVALGLYGLISFVAEQRLSEIGMRKVLGATVNNVLLLFTKEYMKILFVSLIVAAPLAYLIMSNWLQYFAFHINLSPLPFLLGWVVVLFIVVATVMIKVWPAAQTNPVDVLKSE